MAYCSFSFGWKSPSYNICFAFDMFFSYTELHNPFSCVIRPFSRRLTILFFLLAIFCFQFSSFWDEKQPVMRSTSESPPLVFRVRYAKRLYPSIMVSVYEAERLGDCPSNFIRKSFSYFLSTFCSLTRWVANLSVSIVLRQEDNISTLLEDFGFFLLRGTDITLGLMIFFNSKRPFFTCFSTNGSIDTFKFLVLITSASTTGSYLRLY